MKPSDRVGILGGTFDPVHLGHLDAAHAALTALELDCVLLLPSFIPPHRAQQPRASAFHRFAMVSLTASSEDRIVASDVELMAGETSYTIDTLKRLQAQGYGAEQLFFITGADAFAEIATWREYPRVLTEAHFVVVSRPNHDVDRLREMLPELADRMVEPSHRSGRSVAEATAGATRGGFLPISLIDAATRDVSSTEVRRRLALNQPIGDLVPSAVEFHIRKHGLYQAVLLHGQN
jgi:nicotinate-nucleotide adenylyltransferase